MDLYSASAEESATTGCFFDFQEIGNPPKLRKKPLIERLVSEQEAQSESQ